jgi:hypothetical protein
MKSKLKLFSFIVLSGGGMRLSVVAAGILRQLDGMDE